MGSKKSGLLCIVGFVVTMFLIFTSLQPTYQPINVVVDVNVDQSVAQHVQTGAPTNSHLQSIRETREYATTGSEVSALGDILAFILIIMMIMILASPIVVLWVFIMRDL